MIESDLPGSTIIKPINETKPGVHYPYATAADFFENLPVAFYTCNRQGYITSYNHAAVKLWGREPALGKDMWCGSWKIFNPDGTELPLDTCPMARTLKEGVSIEGEEIIVQQPDGTRRNVLAYPAPIFDETGSISGATNTLIDITEQKKSEEKQAMLAAIVASSDDAIISKKLDGVITSWNKAAERLFGYTEQEILGKHITILIPLLRRQEEQLIIDKVRNNQSFDHFETVRVTKTGEEIPISLTVSPIHDSKGQIIGASKIVRDISRQKSSENRLRQYAENLEILNSVGKAIAEDLDIQSILQKVTNATTQLTNAAFGAFFHNVTNEHGQFYQLYTLSGAPKEAFDKFGMPRNTAVFHPTFTGQGVVRVDDITKDPRYGKNPPHFGMPEGHLSVVSYLAVPVTSKSGSVLGGLFFGHPEPGIFTADHEQLISAIAVQTAVALDNAKLYEEIKLLNAKKDEFIGLASHELKTPVTSISGYLQIIEQSFTNEDRNKIFISKARSQVNKLAALISDLLDVSKIQTGKLPLTFSTFDLAGLLKEVTEIMQQINPLHQITLNSDAGNLTVEADYQRIEQVLINLISNAVKYSPDADRVIVNACKAGDKIRVSIQDFGIGIEPEQQERIFSRFYRVENLAAHMSGLGIGLYISQEIVKRHHGKLWVKSAAGKGSTFLFEIPVMQVGRLVD
ncbi:MAG: domain S-box protein [Mucilaginibacter sp.]|nr:domain S-box protein [Mucilaginibacter sp.]